MLTLITDQNITHLHDYFNEQVLGQPVQLIAMAGRDITADIIAKYQPDALLIRSVTMINAGLLADNDSVKFVGSATIGTDHVDQDYLASREIIFANAAGCSKHSVAQYVMTVILNLRPQYWQSLSNQKQINKQPVTLGIIGLGNIGSTLAKYATDLGWQVLGYDPLLPPSSINNAGFDEVLANSNVISLHVPLTTGTNSPYPTYHLFNESAFAKMPASTMLINSARGPVVNEEELLKDIKRTQRQVVLDVFEHEPVVSGKVLDKLAIATPHIAGYTLEGKLRGTQMIFETFVKVFAQKVNASNAPTLASLLPINPYRWQDLIDNPDQLAKFYDIKADDALLRDAVGTVAGEKGGEVSGQAFDTLRKTYDLRREWTTE